jgi:hypothetical protein
MQTPNYQIENGLNKEITLTHTPTSYYLLKQSPDAFTLYHFYCYTASWQGNNPIKATNQFAMSGLKWGKTRLSKAKKILQDTGIVKDEVRRNKEGKIEGNFILVRYINPLSSGTENHPAVCTTSGSQPTNTNKDNINTNKEKESICESKKNFLEYLATFNSLTGKKYQPTKGRQDKYNQRLKSYSHTVILTSLKNMLSDPFFTGGGERGWEATPDYLIRNDEQIDRFYNFKPKKKSQSIWDIYEDAL